jgi:hypothetical protein
MILLEYIKRLEEHKGRKLELNNRRDLMMLASIVEREVSERDAKISSIENVLGGHKTYDPKELKTIHLSDRDKFGA